MKNALELRREDQFHNANIRSQTDMHFETITAVRKNSGKKTHFVLGPQAFYLNV